MRGLRRGFEVLDLGSREGTIVNGTRMSRETLKPGDILTLGSASVVLDELRLDAPEAPARPDPPPTPPAAPLLAGADGPRAAEGFDLQLYRAVRGSSPLLASVAIHGAVALLAVLLTPTSPGSGFRPGAVAVSQATGLAPEEDAPGIDEPSADLFPEPPASEAPEFEPVLMEQALSSSEPDPALSPPSTRGGEIPSAITVGGRRDAPAERPPAPDFEANPAFEGSGAAGANRAAADLLRRGMGGGRGGDRGLLERLDPRGIHICEGCYDRVEEIFGLLGVRHDTLKPEELAAVPLAPDGLLVIDCGVDVLGPEAAEAVRSFVASGGYLCTTDWGLENVLEPAFPGMLRSLFKGGRGVSTQNETVGFRIVAPMHPLTRGLRAIAEGGLWWVEDQAHPVEVVDTRRVTVLAESDVFKKRYGSGVLAATFGWGKGKVLHILGHAWQREGNLKGTYAMQRLVLNFLLDRAATQKGTATSPSTVAEPTDKPPRKR